MKRFNTVCTQSLIYSLLLVLFSPWALADEEDWVYTIRPGDTLWRISNEYLIGPEYWPKVQQHNGIYEVFELVPGTRLSIPRKWLKVPVFKAEARVVALKGKVQRLRAGKTSAMAIDDTLVPGEVVRTGVGGSVSIEFADGSSLFVLPESEILLEEPDVLALGKGVSVHLFRGRVESKVARQKGNNRYQITTPAAVAAVRGTRFRVGVENEGEAMRSEVLGGRVAVMGSGVERDVRANFGTFAEVGVPPLPAAQLPDAPSSSSFVKKRLPAGINIQWQPVPEVVAYRAQLAADEAFVALIAEQVVSDTQVSWVDLDPGGYAMRVRSQSEQGFEGADVSYTFEIKAPLTAPTLTAPADGVVFSVGRQPFFAWSRLTDVNTYVLQLAQDEAFSQGIEEVSSLVNTHYKPYEPLAAGQYYWRIMGKGSGGRQSDFSSIRRFTISE